MITWAYLGITCLRRGDLALAREAADKAKTLMEQVGASAYTHFEAFAAVAEIYLSLWELQVNGESAAAKELTTVARYLCDSLRRGTTKSGRASAWLYQGWYKCLDGHPRRAYKHWQKGLVVAEEVGMPYELGRIHLEMGRHAALDNRARAGHLQRAREIFERMGTNY